MDLCVHTATNRSIAPLLEGSAVAPHMELMEGRCFQLNFTSTSSQHLSVKVQTKSANSSFYFSRESGRTYIQKKTTELLYQNQSCPASWSCQKQGKFMLVLIMALKSSLMNYLWVCLFGVCFTHSTWVTSANFHLITDVLSQSAEYLGLKNKGLANSSSHGTFFLAGSIGQPIKKENISVFFCRVIRFWKESFLLLWGPGKSSPIPWLLASDKQKIKDLKITVLSEKMLNIPKQTFSCAAAKFHSKRAAGWGSSPLAGE